MLRDTLATTIPSIQGLIQNASVISHCLLSCIRFCQQLGPLCSIPTRQIQFRLRTMLCELLQYLFYSLNPKQTRLHSWWNTRFEGRCHLAASAGRARMTSQGVRGSNCRPGFMCTIMSCRCAKMVVGLSFCVIFFGLVGKPLSVHAQTFSSRSGWGSIPYSGGCTFRVWAPNASKVTVAGQFNSFSTTANPLVHDPVYTQGSSWVWSVDVPGATAGQQYKYYLNGTTYKQDPRCRRRSPKPATPSFTIQPISVGPATPSSPRA